MSKGALMAKIVAWLGCVCAVCFAEAGLAAAQDGQSEKKKRPEQTLEKLLERIRSFKGVYEEMARPELLMLPLPEQAKAVAALKEDLRQYEAALKQPPDGTARGDHERMRMRSEIHALLRILEVNGTREAAGMLIEFIRDDKGDAKMTPAEVQVRERSLLALARISGDYGVDLFIEMAGHKIQALKEAAILCLSHCTTERAAAFLIELEKLGDKPAAISSIIASRKFRRDLLAIEDPDRRMRELLMTILSNLSQRRSGTREILTFQVDPLRDLSRRLFLELVSGETDRLARVGRKLAEEEPEAAHGFLFWMHYGGVELTREEKALLAKYGVPAE
jgi:hypothetical protein